MCKRTLSQQAILRDARCAELVTNVVKKHPGGMQACEVLYALRDTDWINNALVRRVLNAMVEAESIESQRNARNLKLYFMPGCGPRSGAVIVPAAQAPAMNIPQANWLSALGAAA